MATRRAAKKAAKKRAAKNLPRRRPVARRLPRARPAVQGPNDLRGKGELLLRATPHRPEEGDRSPEHNGAPG